MFRLDSTLLSLQIIFKIRRRKTMKSKFMNVVVKGTYVFFIFYQPQSHISTLYN